MPKPKKKKKKFIDLNKESTATFVLVHRSQRDPLAADEDAPQRLLKPLSSKDELKRIKEEERKFGVFYDDDYDYLQHLKTRDTNDYDWDKVDRFLPESKSQTDSDKCLKGDDGDNKSKAGLQLPIIVFPTRGREEEVGLLNKAAIHRGPRLDWDPEIVETLDEDFDHDVVLTLDAEENDDGEGFELDDIIAAANVEADDSSDYSDEAYDEVASLGGGFSDDDEVRSKFTSYSMSSSVIRRNEQLCLLDDCFEKFMDKYDDENVGGLELEDVEGFRSETSDVMTQMVERFEADKKAERLELDRHDPNYPHNEGNSDTDVEVVEADFDVETDQFDCESILTTYSNLYNHPKVISERKIEPIRVAKKTGIPKDVLGKGLTAHALKMLDASNDVDIGDRDEHSSDEMTLASRISQVSIRNKHESRDEKKARKKAVKELRQERRIEKKANTMAFKEEKCRQERTVKVGRQTPLF